MEKCHLVEITCRDSFIGLAVAPDLHNQSSIEAQEKIADRILRFMGFNGTDEYIDALPGLCRVESKHTIKTYRNCQLSSSSYSAKKVFFIVFLEMKHIDYSPFGESVKSYLKDLYEESVNERRGEAFALPLTIHEMKQTYGFKKMPKKRLWFCDDWSE